jgi:hypothetical protein
MKTASHSMLATVIDEVCEPHLGNHDPEDGGKREHDCNRCILEVIGEELDGQAYELQQYRAAHALSALEVMPSGAAIDRAARHMFSRSIGSLSSTHHAAEMREYDARPDTQKAYWRTVAKELLRCAAGLPMEGV